LRLFIIGEAEVERRAHRDLTSGGLDHGLSPGRAPALLDLGQEVRSARRHSASEQGPKNAVHQPSRSPVNERQSSRDERVVGRAQADLLSEREAQNHPRLAVVGQPLPGRAVDQRIEIRHAAQHFPGNRECKPLIGWREAADPASGIESLAASKDGIEDLKRRAARS
jgi:hypothetical protein